MVAIQNNKSRVTNQRPRVEPPKSEPPKTKETKETKDTKDAKATKELKPTDVKSSTQTTQPTQAKVADTFDKTKPTTTPTVVKPEPPQPALVPCVVDPAQEKDAELNAAKASKEVLRTPNGDVQKQQGDREILTDAPDATIGTVPSEQRSKAIKEQLDKNTPVVANKIAKLPPEDQQRYEEMDAKLAQHNDDDGRLSMQTMLLEDRLDSKTMTEMHRLSTSKKADGLENNDDKVFRETVRELAVPDRINQGERNTCAATVPLIQLAKDDPAEYARLVNGMSSPEGKVVTKGGDELQRVPGLEQDDGSGRTITQRLLAPALMEYANGRFASYDNKSDQHRIAGQDVRKGGLAWFQAESVHETLTGRDFKQLGKYEARNNGLGTGIEYVGLKQVEESLKEGKSVPVGMNWGDKDKPNITQSMHKVLVTGITEENGQRYVEFTNPHGTRERMKAEDFESRMFDAQA